MASLVRQHLAGSWGEKFFGHRLGSLAAAGLIFDLGMIFDFEGPILLEHSWLAVHNAEHTER